jgi:hypothetical protein
LVTVSRLARFVEMRLHSGLAIVHGVATQLVKLTLMNSALKLQTLSRLAQVCPPVAPFAKVQE